MSASFAPSFDSLSNMTLSDYLRLQYGLFLRLFGRKSALSTREASVVEQFHQLYYGTGENGGTWMDTRWFGCRILKCPLDMWVYQEILFETKPDLIVEHLGDIDGFVERPAASAESPRVDPAPSRWTRTSTP